MVHLSRLAEDVILFSSEEFGFFEIHDSVATGSSLMPQKKNPDPLELVRGKSGKAIGLLTGWLTTMKGLPLGYNKDLQEDKAIVFEAEDLTIACARTTATVVRTLTLRPEVTRAAASGLLLATEVADYLVCARPAVPRPRTKSPAASSATSTRSAALSISSRWPTGADTTSSSRTAWSASSRPRRPSPPKRRRSPPIPTPSPRRWPRRKSGSSRLHQKKLHRSKRCLLLLETSLSSSPDSAGWRPEMATWRHGSRRASHISIICTRTPEREDLLCHVGFAWALRRPSRCLPAA